MDKTKLETLLDSMLRTNASTLHLVAGSRPAIRVQEKFMLSDQPPTSAEDLEKLTSDFLFDDHRERVAAGEEVKVLYTSKDGVRFRTVVMRHAEGLSVVFRPIPTAVPSLEDLGLPPLSRGFIEFQSGVVILSGFFGSGKSTTLAALVREASETRNDHIVTIEDPIEFIYESSRVPVHQRELGIHVSSTPQGVKDAYRCGARVIIVSELKDYETLDAVLTASERGALVLTTMHASSVMGSVSEMIRMMAPGEERGRTRARLATNLRVVASQTLLRRSHNNGRIPLLEILINNSAVAKVIRSSSLHDLQELMRKGRGLGMQTADMALRTLLSLNLISEEEALYHAQDRDQVRGRGATLASI